MGEFSAQEQPQPPAVRIGDAERDRAIERLRDHTADGRLTLDEFSDRVEQVFDARTDADLRRVLADLPGEPAPAAAAVAAHHAQQQQQHERLIGVMSAAERKGAWWATARISAFAFWGAVHLDFTHATLLAPVIDVDATAIMGGIEIVVPDGIAVDVSSFVLMGGLSNRVRNTGWSPGQPLIRVRGAGMWGGITVRPTRSKRRPAVPSAPPPPPSPPPIPGFAHASSPPPPVRVASHADAPTLTIVVTDIVGSTTWAERLGDQLWLGVLQEHNAIVREAVTRHGGTEVKQSGDGFLLTFTSTRAAVRAALEIERGIGDYAAGHPAAAIAVRVGVHAGEVEREGHDVFGVNVSTAARLCDAARAGEVLVSGVVADLADSTSDLRFGPPTEITLAGRTSPVRVHRADQR